MFRSERRLAHKARHFRDSVRGAIGEPASCHQVYHTEFAEFCGSALSRPSLSRDRQDPSANKKIPSQFSTRYPYAHRYCIIASLFRAVFRRIFLRWRTRDGSAAFMPLASTGRFGNDRLRGHDRSAPRADCRIGSSSSSPDPQGSGQNPRHCPGVQRCFPEAPIP